MSIEVDAGLICEIKHHLEAQGRRAVLDRLETVEPALHQEIVTSLCELWDALETVACSPKKREEIHVRFANAILAPVEAACRTTRSALGAARAETNMARLRAVNTEAKLAELVERSARRG